MGQPDRICVGTRLFIFSTSVVAATVHFLARGFLGLRMRRTCYAFPSVMLQPEKWS